jgi:hypothetical protein
MPWRVSITGIDSGSYQIITDFEEEMEGMPLTEAG